MSFRDTESGSLSADRVDASVATLARVQSDFGGLVGGKALGVVRPQSLIDLSRIVEAAGRRGACLTIRGGGLSQSGQALPDDCVVVDMSGSTKIHGIDPARRTVTCDSGVTWRQILAETLPIGLCPRVQPLNLDLTVGGTLSAGGLGSTSHRHGFAASHVLSAEVVLGTGELVMTGPTQNRDVFDAVFGGLGRVAVLGSVELELEPAPPAVETMVFRYDDCELMLRDQLELSTMPSAYHLGGMCAAAVHGLMKAADGGRAPLRHWSYGLELTLRSDRAGRDERAALERLTFQQVLHRETEDLGSFLARYDTRFQLMRATGAWEQAHPWFEALVPMAAVEATLRKIMNLPPFFGDGHRVTVVADRDHPTSIAYPPGGPAMVVAVLPVGIPAAFVPKALEATAALDAHVQSVGGRRYLSGWLSRSGEFSWQSHYGDDYERLVSLKRRFDPAGVFRSKLFPLC